MRLCVLALVTACGDGVAGPDAAMEVDGAVRGRVTVNIAGPNSGFERVFFQNADSTLALATRTNDAGVASAVMAAGGFVSVFDGNMLYTWTGVQPGDELTLDLSFVDFGDVFPSTSVRIDPMENAIDYQLYSRCEVANVAQAIEVAFAPFFQPCGTTSDLMLVAHDIDFTPLGYRYAKNAGLQGGVIDMRGPYSPFTAVVDVVGPTNRPVTVRQKLSNLVYTSSTSGMIADTHLVLPTHMPAIPGVPVQSIARTFDLKLPKEDGAELTTERAVIVWGESSASTTLDLMRPSLPDFTTGVRFDPTSTTIHWTETPGEVAGDVIWAHLADEAFQWKVIARRTDETFLRLPVMPYEELRLRPDSFFVHNFALVTADGGYDRLRPYLLGHWSPTDGNWWPMKEATGRVSYRSLQ